MVRSRSSWTSVEGMGVDEARGDHEAATAHLASPLLPYPSVSIDALAANAHHDERAEQTGSVDCSAARSGLVEPRCIVPLPRSVDARIEFLVEPLAVAVHGVRRAGLHGGQKVLVVGGRSIGLAAVAAKAHVALVARHSAQIAAGKPLGAEIVESAGGGDYDVVLECADSTSAIATACEALPPNGTLLMLASSRGSLELPGLIVAAKELDIVVATMDGRAGAQPDVDTSAQILGERGEAILEALVSHRFPLAKATEAFAMARDRHAGAGKLVLDP